MLYGIDLEALGRKIALYREGRRRAGYDPAAGMVSLTLHTMLHRDLETVEKVIETPFKAYIRSALDAHLKEGVVKNAGSEVFDEAERATMLEYSYRRYCRTGAIFGSVEHGRGVVDAALRAGVDEIACLVDFGVDYAMVEESLPYLRTLVNYYR
jgi:alkanesulfonate monooxygenase SsuD/methylene tetrahydromethanopterin reductase-like flavin-dependent oxidoreductase (luciferase family)